MFSVVAPRPWAVTLVLPSSSARVADQGYTHFAAGTKQQGKHPLRQTRFFHRTGNRMPTSSLVPG